MRDSELDEMSPEEFHRKYDGTWEEIKAQSLMKKCYTGGNGSSLKHPEDRGINSNPAVPIPGKHEIEKKCWRTQQEKTRGYIYDAVEVRKKEILDPEEMPITKLMDLAVKIMPQKVEGEVEHRFTYGDMILKASKNLEKIEFAEEAKLIGNQEEASND
jgi:hypothetical protein